MKTTRESVQVTKTTRTPFKIIDNRIVEFTYLEKTYYLQTLFFEENRHGTFISKSSDIILDENLYVVMDKVLLRKLQEIADY